MTVWNRSPDKCAALAEAGAKVGRRLQQEMEKHTGSAASTPLSRHTTPARLLKLGRWPWSAHSLSCRSPASLRPLHSCLQVAATPADVVAACDITLAMLSDPDACLQVATGAATGGCGKGLAGRRAGGPGLWQLEAPAAAPAAMRGSPLLQLQWQGRHFCWGSQWGSPAGIPLPCSALPCPGCLPRYLPN